jgi:CBS domain-containing protein
VRALNIVARDLMSKYELVTVSPRTTVLELDRVLNESGVSGVPVVNAAGEVVGVVSQSDVIRFLYHELNPHLSFFSDLTRPQDLDHGSLAEHLRETPVREIMHDGLYSVPPDADVPTIAHTLRRHHIHRVLVLENKQLLGVISTFDLIAILENPDWTREAWLKTPNKGE